MSETRDARAEAFQVYQRERAKGKRGSIPWFSRMLCRYLWHSYQGVLNEHGVLKWLVCRRCGRTRDLIDEMVRG